MRTLDTARLILRPLQASDETCYRDLYTDAGVMRHIAAPLSPQAALHAFRRTLARNHEPQGHDHCWAIVTRASADMVGLIGLRRPDAAGCAASGEIGILLMAHAQGRGYAREAISALAEHGFRDAHLARLVLTHFPANSRMGAVAAALGFVAVVGEPSPSPAHCRWELRHGS